MKSEIEERKATVCIHNSAESLSSPKPNRRTDTVAKCPKCGVDVETPLKEWKMKGRKEGHPDEHNTITVQQFRCPCGKSFRKGIPQKVMP